ncbi:MAG TPA: hypothetical protein VHC46_06275 [Thermodesulfobacteriota bacterium]|nr:hypothetical protein [Candidatus Paceibacterota bacterium]HVY55345.1 hypothetical protein [Thermodesulfobacteriota bacterium]
MDPVLNLYKKKSETPLQTVERYVKAYPEYAKTRMTYAGRLDPMAEGVLVVLSGEKNKEREAYTGLDKDYEFEFILGVETDTFDVLGKIASGPLAKAVSGVSEAIVAGALKKYTGKIEQKYPPYSSKVLDGVPLFELARKGKLAEKDIPIHVVEAKDIELVSSRSIPKDRFVEMIYKDISAVQGDFRQDEILKAWDLYFADGAPDAFMIYKARVSCGSGFYVRQLVSDVGRDLGIGAVTVSILRTRVGSYNIADSIK